MTTLRLVAPPTSQIVTLDQAKAHLNVDFADDDTLIGAYIDAAGQCLDHLNRAILPSTWAVDLDTFQDELLLPKPPLNAVTSITYLDASGAEQTLSGSVYSVIKDSLGQGIVRKVYGQEWPDLYGSKEPVTINFTAGYSTIPGPIIAAALLIIGGLYEQRAQVTAAQVFELPCGVDALLANYRIWTP
jgi:uncharacterized phiE125 gp8 family phage protein